MAPCSSSSFCSLVATLSNSLSEQSLFCNLDEYYCCLLYSAHSVTSCTFLFEKECCIIDFFFLSFVGNMHVCNEEPSTLAKIPIMFGKEFVIHLSFFQIYLRFTNVTLSLLVMEKEEEKKPWQ